MARFRQQFADAAADLFTQVLVLCARLGMGRFKWTFICTIHNPLIAIHSGHLTTWTLATLDTS